jgi:protein-S-isoprenylcysteine O-methyltransferase Ste14
MAPNPAEPVAPNPAGRDGSAGEDASPNYRPASLAATVVLLAAVLVLLMGRELLAPRPLGLVVQAMAAALMLWARLTFGLRSFHAGANPTQGGLVTTGPYRFVRHPIYAAILLFLWGGIAIPPSIVSVVARVLATVAIAVRIASEERLLVQRYPEYAAYAARTRRVVPFIV